ncbi:ATP-binding protein [Mediterraneibacter gnavus]|uniref:ATP-binding protein n=1 Tax=Mediterraneibacter gnavus TaxID=33038 RepID=UPI0036D2A39F
MNVPDIPKIYTALAEWFSCCVFVLALEKRYKKCYTICVLLPFLPVFCVLQYYIGVWPVVVWIPSMVAAMILIYLCIFSCCKVNWKMAMVCFATAFMIAEFSASFEWQIYSYVMGRGHDERVIELIFLVLFYSILFALAYFLEYRYFSGEIRGDISLKEALSSVIMAIAVFLISNISYVYPDTPFSSSLPGGLFYIRTLVDFSGLLILFLQRDRWRELSMQKEMETVNAILRRQYEQYNLSKENIEIINRKYHDLKHQIAVVRAERNSDKREQYLQEMENDIKMYEAQNKTGNKVLDTILTGKHLYCVQHEINFTCVADGMLLDFMNLMDICTIFGNALDNAIECVEKIGDKSKRLIRTAVYSQSKFLIIRFENYTELELTTKDSLPITTKKDRQYHGYGLKSIRSTVEKYGGSMTVNVKDNWFILRLLIPEEKSL